jgi:hypothetical protein
MTLTLTYDNNVLHRFGSDRCVHDTVVHGTVGTHRDILDLVKGEGDVSRSAHKIKRVLFWKSESTTSHCKNRWVNCVNWDIAFYILDLVHNGLQDCQTQLN